MSEGVKVSRRRLLTMGAAASAGLGLSGTGRRLSIAAGGAGPRRTVAADEALKDLLEGNKRFAQGKPTGPRRGPADFSSLSEGQFPEAIVVACADSRVPVEILFDVGVGDLFVVRLAGNVISGAGATVKGSIEYAVAELGVGLVVVLGHSACGAVKAAIQHIDAKDSLPGSINDLVELIKPAVSESRGGSGDLLEKSIRANVTIGVDRLRGFEPILAPRVRDGKLEIVGGVYDLRSGRVSLL